MSTIFASWSRPSPVELVQSAADALSESAALLEDLRAHVAAGHAPESAGLIVSALESKLGVVGVRARAAVRAAGGPTRWAPR